MVEFWQRNVSWMVLGAAMVLLSFHLSEVEITNINCRFALMTAEIGTQGFGPFATLYGKPYTDYQSLLMLLMYWATGCGRWVNMFTLALPTLIATFYTLAMTCAIGRFVSLRLGIYGVLLTLLSFEFLNIARAPGLDMFVAAAVISAMYALLRVDFGGSRWWWLVVPLCLVFGFAFRGPIGLVIPGAVVVAYAAVRREWTRMLLWLAVCGVTLAVTGGVLLFWAYRHGGRELLDCFFLDQVLSRFGNSKPFWYFFADAAGSYALTYILGLIVIVVYLPRLWHEPPATGEKRAQFLLRALVAWVLIVLLGMSIPGTKHLRYVVPVLPAMGLLSGWIFINFDHIRLFDRLKWLLLGAVKVAVTLLAAGWLGTKIVLLFLGTTLGLPFWLPMIVLLVMLPVAWSVSLRRISVRGEVTLLAVAVICICTVKSMVYDILIMNRETAIEMVQQIEAIRPVDRPIVFFNFGPDDDDLKYMINLPAEKRYIPQYVVTSDREKKPKEPQGISLASRLLRWGIDMFPAGEPGRFASSRPMFQVRRTRDALLEMPSGTCFLTRAKFYDALIRRPEFAGKFRVLLEGEMGHQRCVLFTRAEESLSADGIESI